MTTSDRVDKSVDVAMRDPEKRDFLPFGVLPYLGAGLSLAFCYGNAILTLLAPVLGLPIVTRSDGTSIVPVMNPHIQAVMMWLLALVVVIGLVRDRRKYHHSYPLVVGVLGLLVIVGTLYTFFDVRILILGYFLLFIAALLNQFAMLSELNQTVTQQARALESLNRTLEGRVDVQETEIECLSRLKRFLAPDVADLITTQGKQTLLESHRSYIAAVFCDLRGFTSFSEGIEPEESVGVLQTFHEHMGRLVAKHGATIDHRAGDGLMVFFNDPIPCEKPVLQAVKLAIEMRSTFETLNERWKKLGYQLGFGVGISGGYATLGLVGHEGRSDYTANGNVVNLASRLCDEATDGQILISHKAFVEIEDDLEVGTALEFSLKGFRRPVIAYEVTGFKREEKPNVLPIVKTKMSRN